MRGDIRLDQKHGLNPSLMQCFFCLEAKGVALLGNKGRELNKALDLPESAEAPRQAVFDMEPCDKCAGYMQQGVILISVDPEKSPDHRNPWRTGGWSVVIEDAVKRWFSEPLLSQVLKCRFAFVEDQVWTAIGLPK